ncbi:MAG: ABC transporter permease subunit [Bacteroidales bacterium]|nr:ABC transporter permease subunit [Bacteroidota bacterium]MBL6949418.1 ABC transporter permease subunit [Bacteroidales bacterium]
MKLITIELKKIQTYRTFWIIFGLYFGFLALGIIMAEFMVNAMVDDVNKRLPIPLPHAVLFNFPDIWQNLTFFASIRYVLIFPAIVIIILTTNEFSYKTVRQNVVNGMSRNEFIFAKLQIVLLLTLVITFILTLVMFILGLIHSDSQSLTMMFDKFRFVFGFFVQMLTFLCFAFFVGFIFRHTGLAIALFTLYVLIIEPVIYFVFRAPFMWENTIYTYLPVNSVVRVVEYPAIPALERLMDFQLQGEVTLLSCAIPILYSVVMIAIVYWSFNRKDL